MDKLEEGKKGNVFDCDSSDLSEHFGVSTVKDFPEASEETVKTDNEKYNKFQNEHYRGF